MNRVLISFDSIIDIDLGLINMIKKDYNDANLFNIVHLNLPKKNLLYELVNRNNKNPLSAIIQNTYKDNIDNIYEQFLQKEYNNILDNSEPTDLFKLIDIYSKTNLISVNILCKNLYEKQIINKYNLRCGYVYYTDNNIDVSSYDSIYIKNYTDCGLLDNLFGKIIYICNYKFNFDKDNNIFKDTLSLSMDNINKISIIDIYNKDNLEKIIG